MFKGARKALVRAPHRFAGNKSLDDRVVIEWVKDFSTAHSAMELIIDECNSFAKSWRKICDSQQAITAIVSELYQPILEENVYKSVQETPKSTTDAVQGLDECQVKINEQVMPIIEHLEQTVVGHCKACKECIEGVQKALKKRAHKKQDFDRHSNTVEKLYKRLNPTEKDQQALEKAQDELQQATDIYNEQDEKCKVVIPQFLQLMSEFLNPLCSTLYLAQLRVFEVVKNELAKFATSQGLVSNSYDQVSNEWEIRFLTIQPSCEQGLKTLREGDTVKNPMSMPSNRKRDKAKEFMGQGLHKSGDLASKTISRVRNIPTNIQFSPMGMFNTEQEIYDSAPHSPPHTFSNASRRSISSSASSSSIPRISHTFHSPITNETVSTDLATATRVRALSSGSARALSPHRRPSSVFSSYTVKPKSEDDEYATALFTFLGDAPGDVAFKAGDKIRVLDHGDETDDMWWFGETLDGRLGLFPCNYVSL